MALISRYLLILVWDSSNWIVLSFSAINLSFSSISAFIASLAPIETDACPMKFFAYTSDVLMLMPSGTSKTIPGCKPTATYSFYKSAASHDDCLKIVLR